MGTEASKSRTERLKEELYKYALVSAYLFVCFAVIELYADSLQGTQSVQQLSLSLALVKALVLGKFILIGDALSVGARADSHPLLQRIVWKSVAMLFLLIVFKIIEEIVVGWFKGHSVGEVFAEFAQKSPIEIIAPLLLMLLVLVPMVAVAELSAVLSEENLRQGAPRP